MTYKISLIDWKQGREELRYLREKVFVLEWRLPTALEFDHHDETAFHLVAKDSSNNYIATGRMTRLGEIGRIAVRQSHRCLPLYKALFNEFFQLAKEHDISNVFVRCNLDGVDNMTKHGFKPQGKVFMEAGIPMQKLAYPADKPPALPDIKQLH